MTGFYLIALTALQSCGSLADDSRSERVSLWRGDKIPYGTFYAFEQLRYIFPEAVITAHHEGSLDSAVGFIKRSSPHFNPAKGKALQIIVSKEVMPGQKDAESLMRFLSDGNQLFIAAFSIDDSLLRAFDSSLSVGNDLIHFRDSLAVSLKDPVSGEERTYDYPGKRSGGYFSGWDESRVAILGYDEHGRPNFIQMSYEGGGTLFLHLEPMVFTNYFLLHKGNKDYYDQVFSNFSPDIEWVLWNDSVTDQRQAATPSAMARLLKWVLQEPALAWAFYLIAALIVAFLLFEGRRRQRPIPEQQLKADHAVDFVRTIARLYFYNRDNRNIAVKMSRYFQGVLLARFPFTVSQGDDPADGQPLHYPGARAGEINALLEKGRELEQRSSVKDRELMEYHQQLERFYKSL